MTGTCERCSKPLMEGNYKFCEQQCAEAAARAPTPDADELLDDVRAFITDYMILPSNEVADLLALWVLHTHAFEAASRTPYLRIVSAMPECGKTLLMEILCSITRNGWHTVNPSAAVLYRQVDQKQPTLLLDEVDNFPLSDKRDAVAVLNEGYRRGASVARCDDRGDLQEFSSFCPKGFAGLDRKTMPPALLSRSITIRLERKARGERVERWIGQDVEPLANLLRRRCFLWAKANTEKLATHRPKWPDGLGDRAIEIWWLPLSIAELAGDGWTERARRAARVLSAGGDAHDESAEQEQLLSDIRDAFGKAKTISTVALLVALNGDDEKPWGALRNDEGLDPRGLARMLRTFKVRSKQVRVGRGTTKGYHADQFADAFSRYLPDGKQGKQGKHPNAHGTGDVSDVSDVSLSERAA